jgi:hypothetical protein
VAADPLGEQAVVLAARVRAADSGSGYSCREFIPREGLAAKEVLSLSLSSSTMLDVLLPVRDTPALV